MRRHVCEVTGCHKWKNTKPTKMNIAANGCLTIGRYRRQVWLCPSHHQQTRQTVWRSNANTNISYTVSTASNWFVSSGTTANN